MNRTCLCCKQEFQIRPDQRGRKYCNTQCQTKAYRERKKKEKVEPKINQPRYPCSIHGEVTDTLDVQFGNGCELDGIYCMRCLLEKYLKDQPKIAVYV